MAAPQSPSSVLVTVGNPVYSVQLRLQYSTKPLASHTHMICGSTSLTARVRSSATAACAASVNSSVRSSLEKRRRLENDSHKTPLARPLDESGMTSEASKAIVVRVASSG